MNRNHSPRRLLPIVGVLAIATVLGVSACSAEPTRPAPEKPATSSAPAPEAEGVDAIGELEIIHRDSYDVASYLTEGSGGTIVLDAGGGNDASYWNDLVPELAEQTGAAIVTYDRTGAGKSADVPGAFDPAAAGEDLAAVIEELDLPDGPVLLVGHSLAGEVAHALVAGHADLIDGAVLVDANLPPFFTPETVERLVEANTAYIAELEAGPSTRESRQLIAVAENWGPVHTAFHTATWPATIPVAVIVSDLTPFPAGTDEVTNWKNAAAQFVSEASNRSLVSAPGTSHDVALDDQDLVEQQIVRLFDSL